MGIPGQMGFQQSAARLHALCGCSFAYPSCHLAVRQSPVLWWCRASCPNWVNWGQCTVQHCTCLVCVCGPSVPMVRHCLAYRLCRAVCPYWINWGRIKLRHCCIRHVCSMLSFLSKCCGAASRCGCTGLSVLDGSTGVAAVENCRMPCVFY